MCRQRAPIARPPYPASTSSTGLWAPAATAAVTINDCLDIGTDLGSPVSEAYYDKAPFTFNGTIEQVQVQYTRWCTRLGRETSRWSTDAIRVTCLQA